MNQLIQTTYIGMFIISMLFYIYNWNIFTDKK